MISIIIPAYNAAKHIRANYESLVIQLEKDFEVIYVDDGSSDETLYYLEEIQKKDSRVRVLSQNNSGAMIARINGIKLSKHKYVSFLDSDDTVDANYISHFKKYILEGYDLVSTGFVIKKDNKLLKKNNIKSGIYSKDEYLRNVLSKSSWELCGKVFNKKLFDGIDFPDRRLSVAEDTYIFVQTLLNVTTDIIVADSFNYFYHSVENSISRQRNSLFIEDALYVSLELKKKLTVCNVDIVFINSMILLLYSNSLRRGMLPSTHRYFSVIKDAFKVDALLQLPKHKMFFVMICFFINRVLK